MSETGASMGGNARRKFEGPGGTPGGSGEFLIGLVLAAIGFYILFSQVQVHSSYWAFMGVGSTGRSFGVTLIPLLIGIAILFVNVRSLLGWVCAVGGLLLIVIGILVNLNIHFRPTSLMSTIIMLGMIAAGFGLIVKGLRPHTRREDRDPA